MLSNSPDASGRPTNVRWLVFALGCGTSWMLYLHRYTFALIKPELKSQWGLGKDELGLMDSAFALCYSGLQFPCGVGVDLLGVHLFLGGAILVWSIGLGLHALSPGVEGLYGARALFGLGQSGAYAAVSRISKTWFPQSIRTSVQGWMGVFSGRMGAVSANVLFATLLLGVLLMPWRSAIYLFMALGLAHGVVFLLLFRNSPRRHPMANQAEADLIEGKAVHDDAEQSKTAAPRSSPRSLFRRMSGRSILNLGWLNLSSTMSTVADNIYSNWIPLFLAEVHGLEFKEMGVYSALPLLGGACGGAAGGWLNDRVIRKSGNRRWSRSLIGFGGKGTAGVLLLIAMATCYDNPYRFCTMLFFVKFFADISLATRWGTVTDIGGSATASVFAFNNSIAGIGAVLAPVIYGFVAESELGWSMVFVIAAAAYFACATAWLLVNCTIPVLREQKN